jgi:hypothetical protein
VVVGQVYAYIPCVTGEFTRSLRDRALVRSGHHDGGGAHAIQHADRTDRQGAVMAGQAQLGRAPRLLGDSFHGC